MGDQTLRQLENHPSNTNIWPIIFLAAHSRKRFKSPVRRWVKEYEGGKRVLKNSTNRNVDCLPRYTTFSTSTHSVCRISAATCSWKQAAFAEWAVVACLKKFCLMQGEYDITNEWVKNNWCSKCKHTQTKDVESLHYNSKSFVALCLERIFKKIEAHKSIHTHTNTQKTMTWHYRQLTIDWNVQEKSKNKLSSDTINDMK